MQQATEYVDIGPANWEEAVGMLTVLLAESRSPEANRLAREELLRMARLADKYVALSRAQSPLATVEG